MTTQFKATQTIEARGKKPDAYVQFVFENGSRSYRLSTDDPHIWYTFDNVIQVAYCIIQNDYTLCTKVEQPTTVSTESAPLNAFDIERLCDQILTSERFKYQIEVLGLLESAVDTLWTPQNPRIDYLVPKLIKELQLLQEKHTATA